MSDGHLIVLSTYLQLAPKWFVSSSLLVAGHVAQEKSYRVALASSLMASLSLEMVWTWFRPDAPSHRAVAAQSRHLHLRRLRWSAHPVAAAARDAELIATGEASGRRCAAHDIVHVLQRHVGRH